MDVVNKECFICAEKMTVALQISCCNKEICSACFIRAYEAKERRDPLNCPFCRFMLIRGVNEPRAYLPSEPSPAPSLYSRSPTPNMECCIVCNVFFQPNVWCDICKEPVCDDCLFMNGPRRSREDYCAKCLKVFHLINVGFQAQITMVESRTTEFKKCEVCDNRTCYYCAIENTGSTFCIPCIKKIDKVYDQNREQVLAVMKTRQRK